MIPHYKDVPAEWRHPFGPYRQAPPDKGGEWWYTDFFTGITPWVQAAPPKGADPEFVKVFGARPGHQDPFYQEWLDNEEQFQGVKLPEWMTQDELDAANEIFVAWGMGKAVIYEGRYGFSARFPETGVYEFEANAYNVKNTPHLVVAGFQIRLAQSGKAPAKWHPFVPPQLQGAAK